MVSWLSLSLVLAAADAGFDRTASLAKYLAEPCNRSDGWRETWKGLKDPSPCELLQGATPRPRTFEDAAAILESQWQIAAAAASALLEVELYLRTEEGASDAARSAWVGPRYEAALAAAPGSLPVLRALVVEASPELLVAALRQFHSPRASAALALLESDSSDARRLGVVEAIIAEPTTVSLVLESKAVVDPELSLALQLQLFELALGTEAGRARLVPLARMVLTRLLEKGLDELALEVMGELPPGLRAEVLDPAKMRSDERKEELRLELAAAALETGQLELAKTLAPHPVLPHPPVETGFALSCRVEVLQELLWRSRDPRRATIDVYPVARSLQRCYWDPVYPRAFQTLLRGTQPRLLERLRQRAQRELEASDDAPPESVHSFMKLSSERLDAARARAMASLEAMAPPVSDAGVDGPVARLLTEPAASPWVEHPFPAGLEPSPNGLEAREEIPGFPQGYGAIRVDRSGSEVWAVAASQRLDPSGEVTAGGYWLLHSSDGGRTWAAPLYTGLHAMEPYVVVSSSALPLFSGDRVQLEVRRRQLDRSSITFPPVCLQTEGREQALYLEASLADLTRDSDGDGLTDLVEARVLTDAHSADTDGDGLADADDPFPTVPRASRSGELAQLLGQVLARLVKVPPAKPGVRRGLEGDRALFLSGAPSDFAGVNSPVRVVVLSEDQAKRASRERGLFYPMRLEVVIDERHERALITWDFGWRGGSFDATRVKGRWVLVSRGEWIT